MIIFVSSAYGAVFEKVKDKKEALNIALKHARSGARKVLEMGHIPLSPVLAFNGVYDEATQRELAISDSLVALKFCDAVLIVRDEFSANSMGMILEEDLAKNLQKPIYELDLKSENSLQ